MATVQKRKEKIPHTEAEILKRYPRAVVHLRSQYHDKKRSLGLLFGAGVSKPLGFPTWTKLVERIARDKNVRGTRLLQKYKKKKSLASLTQMLFLRFKTKYITRKRFERPLSSDQQQEIETQWMKIIHNNLYADVGGDRRTLLKKHPYLREYVDIIKKIPVTINYNFDDSIETLLSMSRTVTEKQESRGYEIICGTESQVRRESGVIYHPNGLVSYIFNDTTTESITFIDEAFADQLIYSMHGRFNNILDYLSKKTCLLLGMSLEDATLRHLLRQNAKFNPGHYHYFVQFFENDFSDEMMDSIYSSNFEVYNLITLFVDNKGIKNLAKLIKRTEDSFCEFADSKGLNIKFCYYFIGAVGVGKSSAVSRVKSLITYDEWFDERLDLLAKPDSQLTLPQRRKVDRWLVDQFYRKNWRLSNAKEGIHVVDRTPLDPLTFGRPEERRKKPKAIAGKISPVGSEGRVQEGHVICLCAEVNEIHSRLLKKHKPWPKKEICDLQDKIFEVFELPGISRISTTSRSVEEVVKEACRIIHCDEYVPTRLNDRLLEYANQ